MSPQRIQRKRERGWRLPEGAKIVDRTSRWGNPWAVRSQIITRPETDDHDDAGQQHYAGPTEYVVVNLDTGKTERAYTTRMEAHQLAVLLYETITLPYRLEHGGLNLTELRGLDLACYCPLDLDCHARVLLEYANRPDPLTLALERKAGRNPKQYHHREDTP